MSYQASHSRPRKVFFINQFVNLVYGIILGTGVTNSAKEIAKLIQDGAPAPGPTVSISYSIVALVYVVIVVCVYWWDWVDNIGHRVKNTGREFSIDIVILLALECLFFVYKHPLAFSMTFFLLAIFNLCWVYNFRLEEHLHITEGKQIKTETKRNLLNIWPKIKEIRSVLVSYSTYLKGNEEARRHVRRRWYGVAIYGIPLLVAIVLINLDKGVLSIFKFANNWVEISDWIILFLIVITGLINRLYFYRDRFKDDNQ